MVLDYEAMLAGVNQRLLFIKQASLEDDKLNEEWRELMKIQGSLIRLLKLEKGKKNG